MIDGLKAEASHSIVCASVPFSTCYWGMLRHAETHSDISTCIEIYRDISKHIKTYPDALRSVDVCWHGVSLSTGFVHCSDVLSYLPPHRDEQNPQEQSAGKSVRSRQRLPSGPLTSAHWVNSIYLKIFHHISSYFIIYLMDMDIHEHFCWAVRSQRYLWTT